MWEMTAEPDRSVSAVVVTYRRPTLVAETVNLLLPQLGPLDELLVVDQSPERHEGLAAHCRVQYFGQLPPNMVRARNLALSRARGDVVLFVDDDVIPEAGLVAAHREAYGDPAVGGVAGRILEPHAASAGEPDPRFLDLSEGWRYADFTHTARRDDVMTVRGCNMSFRRDLLLRLGGFDTHLRPPFCFREDSEMSFRVRREGYRVVFEPRAGLIHLSAPQGGTRPGGAKPGRLQQELTMYKRHFLHYRDNLYFITKHFRGRPRRRWVADAYCTYVGLSRWPWRLVAKNLCFLAAWMQAGAWAATDKPPYFTEAANAAAPPSSQTRAMVVLDKAGGGAEG
jgi:GT2 family glycosyltransferase